MILSLHTLLFLTAQDHFITGQNHFIAAQIGHHCTLKLGIATVCMLDLSIKAAEVNRIFEGALFEIKKGHFLFKKLNVYMHL